ncbi:ATP-binding protein [Streptomyces sp. CBMA29]|uniref:ATP-binding protein n=1 Tax=Streptomyces sp. CBMA29 TaxID=1896314 RepID=UPI001661E5BE|nr:ATP-binding protein [Streptomyces sp. CBMA29]
MPNFKGDPEPFDFRVLPTAQGVVEARRQVVDVVRRSSVSVSESVLADLALLADEVIANAVTYSRAPCAVCVRWTRIRVRVEVTDCADDLPQRRQAGADDESGRGLQLVEALAADWDVTPCPSGKIVWFEVATDLQVRDENALVSDAPTAWPLHVRGIRSSAVAQILRSTATSART